MLLSSIETKKKKKKKKRNRGERHGTISETIYRSKDRSGNEFKEREWSEGTFQLTTKRFALEEDIFREAINRGCL